eukprot:g5176.t1
MDSLHLSRSSLFLLLVCAPASPVTVVDLTPFPLNYSLRVATFAAAGLRNRGGPNVYVRGDSDGHAAWWLDNVIADASVLTNVSAPEFVRAAAADLGSVVYDLERADWSMHAALAYAGVYSAVPLDARQLARLPGTRVLFNASAAGWSDATDAALGFAHSGLIGNTSAPAIQRLPDIKLGKLVDWILQQAIFPFAFDNLCTPLSKDHRTLEAILSASAWPTPIKTYGYNYVQGGLFEADTKCDKRMAQIASGGTPNLSFLSKFQPFAPGEALRGVPSAPIAYNASKTYVGLVLSDMDNLDKVLGDGKDSMLLRQALCAQHEHEAEAKAGVEGAGKGAGAHGDVGPERANGPCFPLTWSISPQLARMAPAVLRWYYAQARRSGADSFALPPSGALYAYPSEMAPVDQAAFAAETNRLAAVLNTSTSVAWEFLGSWAGAFEHYFPRYEGAGVGPVKTFLLTQVPYAAPFAEFDFYKVLGDAADPGSVVLLRPPFGVATGGTWDSNDDGDAAKIAAQLGKVEAGQVTYLYTVLAGTGSSSGRAGAGAGVGGGRSGEPSGPGGGAADGGSGGGGLVGGPRLDKVFDMVARLPEHVQVVPCGMLGSLARQRELHFAHPAHPGSE